MKKILLVLITTILITGCSSKLITLNEGISKDTPITFGSIPSTEELVTADEETVITEELAGDRYIITATKGDKTEVQEFVVEYNTVDIDGTLPVDMSQFYSNSERLAKVSYVFNEYETVMTITDENGEEPHSFDVPVNVIYPEYTIAEDITIDTYVGYEISEFVTAEEGVEVTSELDEDNSVLSITLSKNDWSVNESVPVTLTSSEPQYPIVYEYVKQVDTAGYTYTYDVGRLTLTFLTETTGTETSEPGMPISWYIEGDYMYVTQNGNHWTRKIWYEGDYLHYSYLGPQSMYGVYTYKLVK